MVKNQLGPEKVPYVTKRAHGHVPSGTSCLISRLDGELVIEFEDGTTIKPGLGFYASDIEDPTPTAGADGHGWVEDADHERSVTSEGMGLFTVSLSVSTDPDGKHDVWTKVSERHWRCSRCGMCVSTEDPEKYGDPSFIQVGDTRYELPGKKLKTCGEYAAMRVTDS